MLSHLDEHRCHDMQGYTSLVIRQAYDHKWWCLRLTGNTVYDALLIAYCPWCGVALYAGPPPSLPRPGGKKAWRPRG